MPKSVGMPRSAARPSRIAAGGEMPQDRPAHAGLLSILRAEFRRALAAVQRYETLKYRHGSRETLAANEISRQVFEEFYAPLSPDAPKQELRREAVPGPRSAAVRAEVPSHC